MCIVIQNMGGDMQGVCRYEVRINNQPPIVTFDHDRNDGLDVCLRKAAGAVKEARDRDIEEMSRMIQERLYVACERAFDSGGPCSR